MTREHYEKLAQYDKELRDLLNDTFHYSAKIQRIFMEVYTEITGMSIAPSEWSCNKCMSDKAKVVAYYYVNGLAGFKKKDEPQEEAPKEITEKDVEENKAERKAIRKKRK